MRRSLQILWFLAVLAIGISFPQPVTADVAGIVEFLQTFEAARTNSGNQINEPSGADRDSKAVINLHKASSIMGMTVRNRQQEKLGVLNDVVIDLPSGKILVVLVACKSENVLDAPDKLVPLPATVLSVADDKTVVVNIDKKRLKSAPSFDRNEWPDLSDEKWLGNLYRFHGVTFSGTESFTENSTLIASRTSELMGLNLKDSGTETVGEIKDLAIDLQSGRIPFAIVSAAGFLGIGERWIAVPTGLFDSNSQNGKHLILNADKQTLKSAPAIDRGDWAKVSNQPFVAQVYRHFGQQPYGQATREIQEPSGTQPVGTQRDPLQKEPDRPDDAKNPTDEKDAFKRQPDATPIRTNEGFIEPSGSQKTGAEEQKESPEKSPSLPSINEPFGARSQP